MKKCSKCGIVKSTEKFNKDIRHKDGLQSQCKSCKALYDKSYRQNHKEQIVVKHKIYYQTISGKATSLRNTRKQRRKFPERAKALWTINNAIRAGGLKRSIFCEGCGLPAKTEGHHPDYTKPLEVYWLCRSCHQMEHLGVLV